MTDRTCTRTGCEKRLYAKGMCGMHYQQSRQAAATAECCIDGCSKTVYSIKRGTCRTHYNAEHDRAIRDDPHRRAQHAAANSRYLADGANHRAKLERERRRRRENPERGTAYRKAWRARNPERYTELSRQGTARRRALVLASSVEHVDYAAILAEHGMVCHLCKLPIIDRADLHFDHVIPLSKGGPHAPSNVRPAHARCNLRKGARLI